MRYAWIGRQHFENHSLADSGPSRCPSIVIWQNKHCIVFLLHSESAVVDLGFADVLLFVGAAVAVVAPRLQALLGGMPGLARVQVALSNADKQSMKLHHQWHGGRVSERDGSFWAWMTCSRAKEPLGMSFNRKENARPAMRMGKQT